MKTKTLLIAAAMLLCFSAASFAQQIYTTSSTPVTTVIDSGNAELAGNITFTTSNVAPAINGTISIQYGGSNVNITSSFSSSIKVCSNITGAAGYTPGAPCPAGTGTITGLGVNTTASSYNPGLLVIDVPAGMAAYADAGAGVFGAFTVVGVRVQIAGQGLTNLTANISATGNQIAAQSTSLTVINSIRPGISTVASYTSVVPLNLSGSGTAPTAGAPVINAVNGTISNSGNNVIAIKEGFLNAYSANVGVRISVSAVPPAGITYSFPDIVTSYNAAGTTAVSQWVRRNSDNSGTAAGLITSSSTASGALNIYYFYSTDVGNVAATTTEYLEVPVTISTAAIVPPVPSVTPTYTVTLAPVLSAYDSNGAPRAYAPRFEAVLSAANTLVTVAGSSTALLVPYAYASQTAGDTNTALAITNTSEDPGLAVLGFAGAVPNSGTITFYMFPQSSTLPMFKYTTVAGSPGAGLDASGNLLAGGTYSVFLNQLTPLATPPTGSTATLGSSFTGYLIIVTNFTNAHGMFVMSNFTNLTSFTGLMPVLDVRTVMPEKLQF